MPFGLRLRKRARRVRKAARQLRKATWELRDRLVEPFDPWRAAWQAYGIEAARWSGRLPTVGRLELWRDFLPWHRSQKRSSFDDEEPWMTFEGARLLRRSVGSSARVLEYGSGGSTLMLGRRAAQVVSVEHDAVWHARVQEAAKDLPAIEVVLAEPREPATPEEATVSSTSPGLERLTFVDYVAVADRYPEHHFDVLIVDGRARPSAFFRAEPKVRVGGIVLLDDSERPTYSSVVDAATAAGWTERGRYGPRPYTQRFGRTTLWTKTCDLSSVAERAPAGGSATRMTPAGQAR